jgi:AICAR transformylase/IMP cyclohydrolase PurH
VVSAFGSIVALNRNVDVELAQTIMESYSRFGKVRGAGGFFAEVIIAPKFEQDAVEIIRTLKAWGGRVRLMETGPIDRARIDCGEFDARCIVGGMLLQQRDLVGWDCGRDAPAAAGFGRVGGGCVDLSDEGQADEGAA